MLNGGDITPCYQLYSSERCILFFFNLIWVEDIHGTCWTGCPPADENTTPFFMSYNVHDIAQFYD